MPRPRFDNMDPDKKRRLLDAATAEFAAHGYELARVNRILEAAGQSKGSFYYYFDDKLDLAATVLLAVAEPSRLYRDLLQLPATATEFWEELRRFSMTTLKELESKRVPYECMIRLSHAIATEPQLAARVLPLFEPGRQQMMSFLQRGVEVGALRTDVPLFVITKLIEATKLTAYRLTFPGDAVPSDAEMESFSDLVLDLARRIASP